MAATKSKITKNIKRKIIEGLNNTHRKKLCSTQFSTKIYSNRTLAASGLFPMFTQWIKFYTFHYRGQVFEQNDS